MIDNLSAKHVNTATTQEEKQPNEDLDVFSAFIQFMLWSSFSFARFKDDISRALWRLPLPGSIFVWTYRKAQHWGASRPALVTASGRKLAWRSHALLTTSAARRVTVWRRISVATAC